MSGGGRHRTALHAEHLKLGAKMTDFHGWEMPLYYTSILEEHRCVRSAVGLFDISHMGQVWVSGPGALETLNELVVSDLSQVGLRRACYTMLLNERGGIIDDIIVYRVGPQDYLVIINCGGRQADVEWMLSHQRAVVDLQPISDGRAMVAVQGPAAARLLDEVLRVKVSGMGRFDVLPLEAFGPRAWVARTGYTGGDGFELFAPEAQVVRAWTALLERGRSLGVQPIGLGARDTLRLEAGLRLYGTDMDQHTTPYDAGVGWTVAIHKPSFIGKAALMAQQATGLPRKFIGFEMGEGPVPRQGCALVAGTRPVGTVTSGTFSATLNKSIGMGYVETAFSKPGTALSITIRTKTYPVSIVKLPFWKPAPAGHEAPAGSSTVMHTV